MKKLFSMVLLALVVFALAACDADPTTHKTSIEVRIGEGESQTTHDITFDDAEAMNLLDLLESHVDITVETTDFGPFVTAIGHLEADERSYIAFHKNGEPAQEGVGTITYNDGDVFVFTLEVILSGLWLTLQDGRQETTVYATYDEADEPTLLDVVSTAFDVETSESDWGLMLEAIGFIEPPEGSFIALYHNDDYATEGIDMTSFENGDAFTFRLTWWDEEAYIIHYTNLASMMIDAYIDDDAQTKVDELNPFVIAGLYHLDMLEHVTEPTIELDEEPTTTALLNAIIAGRAYGQDVGAWVAALDAAAGVSHAYPASLFAMALGDAFYADDLEPFLANLSLASQDIDTLSLIVLAASLYDDAAMTEAAMEALLDVLYETPYEDNGASFALAMIAVESTLDHRASLGEDFADQQGFALAVRLLAYGREDGLFYWRLGDDDVDLHFTSPQAFLALAMLISGADHAFDFLRGE